MKRLSKEERERLRFCSVPGCNRPWTCYLSHGRVCSEHDQPARPSVPVPRQPTVAHWQDREAA